MKYEIMVGTVTYALKAKDLLRRNGFKAYLERKSANIGKYGCGYSVVVFENINKATEILEQNRIKILNIKTGAAQ